MKKISRRFIRICACCFFVLWVQHAAAQAPKTLHYTSIKEDIYVLGEKEGYKSVKSVHGYNHADAENTMSIYYSQLETVENIKASYKANGKEVAVKRGDLLNHSVLSSTFYSDLRCITFKLPKQAQQYPFQYSYTSQSKLLMYLTALMLNDYTQTDTFHYLLHIPAGHSLQYRVYGDTASLQTFNITHFKEETGTLWEILALPKTKMKTPEPGKGLQPAQVVPVMQVLVLPDAEKNNAEQHFNKWYLDLMEPHTHLSDTTFNEITASARGLENDSAVIATVFKTVQKKVHYIDIEDGIRAFQPKDVNAVWQNKQGDCKDMANLLCQTLRRMNYDARVAVSASVYHDTDFAFPALSSGDHCICVVNLNGEWKYLDATDDQCEYGFPSRHTQGRSIFITGKNGGELHTIEKVSAEKNALFYTGTLTRAGSGMQGSASLACHAMSKYKYQSVFTYLPQHEATEATRKELEARSMNLKYDSVSVHDDSVLTIKARIKTSRNFTSLPDKEYLSLSFLPYPHPYPDKIDSTEKLILPNTVNSSYDFTIALGKAVTLNKTEPVSFRSKGFQFRFSVEQTKPDELQIHYQCVVDHIEIEDNQRNLYNQLHELITKTFAKPIVYAIP